MYKIACVTFRHGDYEEVWAKYFHDEAVFYCRVWKNVSSLYLPISPWLCLPLQNDPIGNLNTAFEVAEKYLDIPKMFDADGTTSWRIQCDSMFQIVKIKWFNGSFCLSTNFFLCSALDYIGDAPPETLDYISFSSALYGDSDL